MTTHDSTTTAPTATPAPWHVFAAAYRDTLTAYLATSYSEDEAGEAAQEAAHEAQKAQYEALLAYPVATPHELAEKAELLVQDCWDYAGALGIIAADARIVAHKSTQRGGVS